MLEPTLQNIINQTSLRWIFVGGKGGVGKTTTSCCLASQLSRVRENVLLISTDPAHNLSDAFGQKFSKDPMLVNGFSNLYAMEIDPIASMDEMITKNSSADDNPLLNSLMNEFSMAIPGIDEAMGFGEVMKLVNKMDYSVIVFDTAPTGHTLRFLSFPTVLEKALGKLGEMGSRFGPLFSAIMGNGGDAGGGDIFGKLTEIKTTVQEVNRQFQDADKTTFVCVLIAEFLSLYETERMIQDLTKFDIDTHNLVVNQLVFPKVQSSCSTCIARRKIQKKYLDQIDQLYDDFHIVKLPLMECEVRGPEAIRSFSEYLIKPYEEK